MRILANENFPKEAVEALKERGHDVFWIREEKPGISDSEVLQIAQAEKRLLITFDKDFGALVFTQQLNTAEIGIVLFRIVPRSAAYIVKVAGCGARSAHRLARTFLGCRRRSSSDDRASFAGAGNGAIN